MLERIFKDTEELNPGFHLNFEVKRKPGKHAKK